MKIRTTFLLIACTVLMGLSAHSQIDTTVADTAILNQLDNLMKSWYAQKAAYHNHSQTPFDDGGYENADEDSLWMHRLQLLTEQSLFPMVYNDDVRSWIQLYLRKAKQVSVMLGLAKYYFPMFEEALDKYGCPLELRYLAVIESALNPVAVSKAGATGLWQFMYNTGKMYGLEVSTLVDDRRNPLQSTDAAARHLKDLSELFWGDWVLAIAAYNCGQGNVNKAITRSGGKTNFWDIYSYLPKETRGYVPAFYGAWFVMQYYDKFGIVPAEIPHPMTDTLLITQNVHFKQIAAVLDISIEEIQSLNPQYKRDMVTATSSPAVLVLPMDYILPFERMKDSIYAYNKDLYFSPQRINYEVASASAIEGEYKLTPKYHVVKKGESLGIISKKYRTTVSELAKLNKIKTNATIHPGQQLIIGYTKTLLPKSVQTTNLQTIDTLSIPTN